MESYNIQSFASGIMFLRFIHLAALISISLLNNILSYACSTFSLSILQMLDIWIASNLGLFRINAAMNNCIQFFVWTVFTSCEYVPESNRMIHFTFEETAILSSQSGFHHMSPAEWRAPLSLTSPPLVCLVDYSHSGGCVGISAISFIALMINDVEQLFVCLLSIVCLHGWSFYSIFCLFLFF